MCVSFDKFPFEAALKSQIILVWDFVLILRGFFSGSN